MPDQTSFKGKKVKKIREKIVEDQSVYRFGYRDQMVRSIIKSEKEKAIHLNNEVMECQHLSRLSLPLYMYT